MFLGVLISGICFLDNDKSVCFWLFIIGMCVGLRVRMCMCVLERISVDVYVLRRISVRGMSERVCVRRSDC